AEHHRRTRDEFGVVVIDIFWRRLLAGPLPPRLAVAPHDAEIAGHDAADVERRPIGRSDVLAIELPEPNPVVAAVVGVAVEIEVDRVRRRTVDRRETLPIEAGVHVD